MRANADESTIEVLREVAWRHKNELERAQNRLKDVQAEIERHKQGFNAAMQLLELSDAVPDELKEEVKAEAEGEAGRESQRRDMSIAEWAAAVLKEADRPLSTKQIFERAMRAGWQSRSEDKFNSFRSGLYRESDKDDGLIKKVGKGEFALRDAAEEEAKILLPIDGGGESHEE